MATLSAPAPTAPAKKVNYGLSQGQLMWRKFIRSRTAIIGGLTVIALYLMALFAPFIAPYGADQRDTNYLYVPPQGLNYDPSIGVYVHGLDKKVDLNTLRTTYTVNPARRLPVRLFVRDAPYTVLGVIESDVHLYGLARDGAATDTPGFGVFLLGTDRQGRDMVSRLLLGSQMSLTIGLVGVILSLLIGSVLGVASGYFGGRVDNIMQRAIEIIRSFPAIPLWMALSAALPQNWAPTQVYFAITLILSLIGWTWLARQLRGKVLAIREEEFVMAARLSGASHAWIIFRHLLPAVVGHIIVIATLAMPNMILAESALSFLNLGLRPPLVSWGVLLQEAQNLETLRNFPWLLSPAFAISLAVLSFNFFGDGLRDAADPYSQ